jgi:hypothetical protein
MTVTCPWTISRCETGEYVPRGVFKVAEERLIAFQRIATGRALWALHSRRLTGKAILPYVPKRRSKIGWFLVDLPLND